MALIYISTAEGDPQSYKLPDTPGMELLVGRNEECQISLPQVNGVSGVHCSLYFDGAQYYIIDRQSTNGVFCNGERVENAILKRGDVYAVGEATIVFDPEISVMAPSLQEEPKQATKAGGSGVRKKRSASQAGPAVSASRLGPKVPQYQAKKASAAVEVFTVLYVIVMLGIAFYGGMVLRHWNETGVIFLPWIDPDPQAATPEAAPKA